MKNINWRPKGEGWNQLHLSASNGDLPTLKSLIRLASQESDDDRLSLSTNRESKLDIATKSGDQAFHIALRKGQGSAAKELANAGCNVKALGARGETALHIAASRGMIEEMDWLIREYGFDVHALTQSGSSCVHLAAEEDRCDTLRYLDRLGAKFDVQDAAGDSPLHVAARNGSVGAVTWLIQRDTSLVRKINRNGKDAEAVARDAGRVEAATVLQDAKQIRKRERKTVTDFQKLLAHGENAHAVSDWLGRLSDSDVELLIDTGNLKNGTNAFLEACAGGDVEVCKLLLSYPGKREMTNSKTGTTALQIAASRGHLKLVKYLLEEQQMDPSRADAHGNTALMAAEKGGYDEIVRLLKDAEAKRVNVRNSTLQQQQQVPATPPRQISDNSEKSEHSTHGMRVTPFPDLSASTNSANINDDVIEILERVGLATPQWIAKFSEEGFVTVHNLLLLMEADLTQMKMPKGSRRSLLHEIALKRQEKEANPQENVNRVKKEVARIQGVSPLKIPPKEIVRYRANSLVKPPEMKENVQIDLMIPSLDEHRPEDKKYVLRREGPIFCCSCTNWRLQRVAEPLRTCEHLKMIRGAQAEQLRLEVGSREIVRNNSQVFSSNRRPSLLQQLEEEAALSSNQFINESAVDWREPIARSDTPSTTTSQIARKESNPVIPPHFLLKFEELAIEKVIGEGSFGVVRVATWRGMRVAVKELKVGTSILAQDGTDTDLKREASTMARVCNHDNVVPLVGMVLEPIPCVIMTFMPGGSVEDLFVVPGPKSIRKKVLFVAFLKVLRDAAAGVLHLHCSGVIHRDLSARNLLIDKTGTVRVADFGFARIKEDHLSKGYTSSHVGPIKWMAPEAIRNRKFSEKSDVFGFGVTMWEVIAGERPWNGVDSMDVVVRVCANKETLRLPRCPDRKILSLMERCWAHDSKDRPLMKEILAELDAAWRRADGHRLVDPSAGIQELINSDAFQEASRHASLLEQEFQSNLVISQKSNERLISDSSERDNNEDKSSFEFRSDEKFEEDSDGYVDFHS